MKAVKLCIALRKHCENYIFWRRFFNWLLKEIRMLEGRKVWKTNACSFSSIFGKGKNWTFIKHKKYETRKVQCMHEGNSLLFHCGFFTSTLVKNQQEPVWLNWTDEVRNLIHHLLTQIPVPSAANMKESSENCFFPVVYRVHWKTTSQLRVGKYHGFFWRSLRAIAMQTVQC